MTQKRRDFGIPQCFESPVAAPRQCLTRQLSNATRTKAGNDATAEIDPRTEEGVLLAAARKGSPTAFGDLAWPHAGRLQRIAFRITRNREDAEDTVQDCFKRAFEHFGNFKGESQFSTWLTRIAVNCALMKVRARRHHVVSFDESLESSLSAKYWNSLRRWLSPEAIYAHREIEKILSDEIAQLKPTTRQALLLTFRQGLFGREAARFLGVSHSAFKARLFRARVALRSQFNHRTPRKNGSLVFREDERNFPSRQRGPIEFVCLDGGTLFGD